MQSQLRLVSKPARLKARGGRGQPVDYRVLTVFQLAGHAELQVQQSWGNTRNIVEGPSATHTVMIDADAGGRLCTNMRISLAEGHGGYGSFAFVYAILNRDGLFKTGTGRSAIVVEVTKKQLEPGVAYVYTDARSVPTWGFVYLGDNMALTYGSRSIGPAIIDLNKLKAFCHGHKIMRPTGELA